MSQRRNRRSGVEDRWTKTVRQSDGTTTQVPSSVDGKGMRWRGRYVDETAREHAKGFSRKVDAQRWIDQQTTALTSGQYVDPGAGAATIGTLHPAWAAARTRTKATTDAKLESTWSVHVRDRWQAVAVSDVQTTGVRSWVAGLTAAGSGAATVENALGLLRMICESAVEDRRIIRNPCDPVKPPRRKHAARGYLTHSQVAALVEAIGVHTVKRRGGHSVEVRRPTHGVVVMFLAYTGLRWGEMAALRVSSFDMLRRRVNVTEAVAEVRGTLVWDTPKGHERRSVPFPKFLAAPLAALMVGKGRDALVFTGGTGEVLRVSSFRPNMFAPAVVKCRAADPMFPNISPHDLRHTAASLAISAGANVKAVQTMLGHKSAALTLDTYSGLFPDDLTSVADALDRAAESAADALRTEQQDGPASAGGNRA